MATPIKRVPKGQTKSQANANAAKQKQESVFKDMLLYTETQGVLDYQQVCETLGMSFEEVIQNKKLELVWGKFGCCAIVDKNSITSFDAAGPAEVNFVSEEQRAAVIEALETGELQNEYWQLGESFTDFRNQTSLTKAGELGVIASIFCRLFWIEESDNLIAFSLASGSLAETGSTLCVWSQPTGTLIRISPYTETNEEVIKRVFDVDSGDYCTFVTDLSKHNENSEVEIEHGEPEAVHAIEDVE